MGHVFVCQADLRRLVCDAWLLPTDGRPHVTAGWLAPPARMTPATAAWFEAYVAAVHAAAATPLAGTGVRRVFARSPSGAVPFLGPTATSREQVDWDHVAAVLDAFVQAALALPRDDAGATRPVPLLAVPAVGAGEGGGGRVRGEVADRLLHVLEHLAARYPVDVALVTRSAAMTAALRAHRRDGDHLARVFAELGPDLVARARALATRVRRGEVVLFTGAGTGVPAGLPSWSGLLDRLAGDELSRQIADLGELDKAAIIERRLGDHDMLVAALCPYVTSDRYAIGQALLAGLPVREAVTMNYDELHETAAADAGRRLAVLPYARPGPDDDGWLLKLHGCVREERRADIVLTRGDYVRVAGHRASLTGLLQAMLVTRHMLFVGFGLADDHFHAVMADVRRALAGSGPGKVGTALLLRARSTAALVWGDDLDLVPMTGDHPARTLEVFLDLLANESDQGWQHVLDDAYRGVLAEPERMLRDSLDDLIAKRPVLEGGGAWPAVEAMLVRFGYREPVVAEPD